MLIDADGIENGTLFEAEVCVVGAGPAGITLARALAASGRPICLLESGPEHIDQRVQSLNEGVVEGRSYYPLDSARLRFLGGTSNHWTGWCAPLSPIDFEARAYIPHSGWPIDAEEIARHLPEAARILRLPHPDFAFATVAAHVPPLFKEASGRPDAETRVWLRSPPVRFGDAYRDELKRAPTLRCVLNASVAGFETGHDGRTVATARVLTTDGRTHRVRARAFVLAAGGIENARILLQPAEGRPNGFGNDHDQLGRYFMLHPQIDAGTFVPASAAALKPPSRSYGDALRTGFVLPEREQRRLGLPNHAVLFERRGRERLPASRGWDTLKYRMNDPFGRPERLLDDLGAILGDIGEVTDRILDKAVGKVERLTGTAEAPSEAYEVNLRMEHAPNPDSRIRLSGDRDRLGQRRAVLDWRFSDYEKPKLRETVEALGRAMGAMGLGRIQVADWLRDDSAPWPEHVDGDYHHMGGTRMSASPRTGVVDDDCRVHGTENLYVAGSSVFPTGGYANPTLTIIALSLRLAEHLEAEFTRQSAVDRSL